MYGLKCYRLYHVCRLFPIKNVYSSIFFPTISCSPVKIHVWQVLVCDVSMMQKHRCFYKKKKKLHEKKKKKKKIAWGKKKKKKKNACINQLLFFRYTNLFLFFQK